MQHLRKRRDSRLRSPGTTTTGGRVTADDDTERPLDIDIDDDDRTSDPAAERRRHEGIDDDDDKGSGQGND